MSSLTIPSKIFDYKTLSQDKNETRLIENKSQQSFRDILSIKKEAVEMESLVLSKCFGMIYADIAIDPLTDKKSTANTFYKNMMIDNLCKNIAQSGSFGIAKMVENHLIKVNNIANNDGEIKNE